MSLDALFAPHMPQLYHAAAQVLRHPQDSEDALQEGLLAAFCHLNQFQGRAKFSTWLHSIVVNAALMKLRHRKRELSIASIDEKSEDGALDFESLIPDQRQNPEEEYSDFERSRMLAEAIRKVPRRYSNTLEGRVTPGYCSAISHIIWIRIRHVDSVKLGNQEVYLRIIHVSERV